MGKKIVANQRTHKKRKSKSRLNPATEPGRFRKNTLRVLFALLNGHWRPNDLAKKLGISETTVLRIIQDAEAVGFNIVRTVSSGEVAVVL